MILTDFNLYVTLPSTCIRALVISIVGILKHQSDQKNIKHETI